MEDPPDVLAGVLSIAGVATTRWPHQAERVVMPEHAGADPGSPCHIPDQPCPSLLLAGAAEGHDALRLLDRDPEPGIRVAQQPFRGDRVRAHPWVEIRHRSAQRWHDHLTERDQRPAEAQLHLTFA